MRPLGYAIALAARVHADQVDKSDEDYILHCLAVMEMVRPDREAMIVAVLHDVLEDCLPEEREDVRHQIAGFGYKVSAAVNVLTHGRESYEDYIERIAGNLLARKVKIADLTHNMDPRRIPAYQIVDKDFARWDKYRRALIRLERDDR